MAPPAEEGCHDISCCPAWEVRRVDKVVKVDAIDVWLK